MESPLDPLVSDADEAFAVEELLLVLGQVYVYEKSLYVSGFITTFHAAIPLAKLESSINASGLLDVNFELVGATGALTIP